MRRQQAEVDIVTCETGMRPKPRLVIPGELTASTPRAAAGTAMPADRGSAAAALTTAAAASADASFSVIAYLRD